MIHFTEPQKWLLLAGIIMGGWLLMQLAPILFPFGIGLAIAYLGAPLVDYLENRNRPRILAVILVFSLFFLIFVLLILVIIPLLEKQLDGAISRLPYWIERFRQFVMPHILFSLGLEEDSSNLHALQIAIIQNWQQAGGLVSYLLTYITASGVHFIAWLGNMILIPVITFYLLIDWHPFIQNVRVLIPRRYEENVINLLKECDGVLSQFLRGQLLVMVALGSIYGVGLWLVGIDFALLIGFISGLVSFVPYLGFIIGITLASVVAVMQYQDWTHLIGVFIAFGVGQLLESFWLTPRLVGGCIGLHPVIVIFSVLAGGQLFGFIGILIGLPLASVLIVLLRHAYGRYVSSQLYLP